MENNNKQILQKISDKLLSTLETYQSHMTSDDYDLSKSNDLLNFGIRLGEASADFSNVYELLEGFIQEEYCKMEKPPSKNK